MPCAASTSSPAHPTCYRHRLVACVPQAGGWSYAVGAITCGLLLEELDFLGLRAEREEGEDRGDDCADCEAGGGGCVIWWPR